MDKIKKLEQAEEGIGLIEARRQTEDLQWVKYIRSLWVAS